MSDARHYLSVCAIIKDEASYLTEWIEFHGLVGVEHFYLYDNGSDDETRDVLEPYESMDVATVVDWHDHPGQLSAYHDCLIRFGGDSHWIAFIDADEFLFSSAAPAADSRLPRPPLPSLLRDYHRYAGVAVNWKLFGTSGHVTRPEGLVIDAYRQRAADDDPTTRHVKSIVQPSRVVHAPPPTPHWFPPLKGELVVNELETPVTGPFSPPSFERFQLNHYWAKSVAEARHKSQNTVRSDTGTQRPFDQMIDRRLNAVRDEAILPYVPLLESVLHRTI